MKVKAGTGWMAKGALAALGATLVVLTAVVPAQAASTEVYTEGYLRRAKAEAEKDIISLQQRCRRDGGIPKKELITVTHYNGAARYQAYVDCYFR